MEPLHVRTISGIDQVDRAAWNALVPPGAPPVARWEWLSALESGGAAIASRGWQAHHLLATRGGRLVGAAPAWLKFHSMGEYVYDFGWANAAQAAGIEYYPKLLVGAPLSPLTAPRFLVAPGEDTAAVRRALAEAAVESAREAGCSSVHIIFPPEDEADALAALGFFKRSTLQFHWRNPGYASWDDFLSRFDAKRRHQLRREQGAAQKQGLVLRTVAGDALTKQHAELAWRFYQATAGRYSWGPVQLTAEVFHRTFFLMPDAVEVVLAQRGDEVVAGAFNLRSPTHLYGRYWGCFEEHPFLHFNVCLYHSIDACIRDGRSTFEPGAGGEHKIARGFVPTRIHSVHRVFHKGLEAAVRDACLREARAVDDAVHRAESIAGMKPWPAP